MLKQLRNTSYMFLQKCTCFSFHHQNVGKSVMPKFSILPPILPRLFSDYSNPFKLAWFLTLRTKPFLGGFVWSHKSITGNISPTICTDIPIFGKDSCLVLIAWMISTNPISLQMLIFVTSHFTTLLLGSYNMVTYTKQWNRNYFRNCKTMIFSKKDL